MRRHPYGPFGLVGRFRLVAKRYFRRSELERLVTLERQHSTGKTFTDVASIPH